MTTVKRWKFLRTGMESENSDLKWRKNKWVKVEGELDMCHWGLHACKKPYQAFSYVQGEILALVECRGEHLVGGDKECWREQRVIRAFKWTKKDSLALAIFSAELCLKNFEKEYPDDPRPRQAIEAAKRVLFRDTAKNRSAAGSARSAAGSAARSAARSAAWSAAWSAARSAWSAWSARSAAWSARSAAVKKIIRFFDKRVKLLKEIK